MPSLLRLTVALPEADQAIRRVEDDDDQHNAENELPGVRQVRGRVKAYAFEHRRSRERAEGMGATTENRDEHELARLGPESELGGRDLLNGGNQRAADAAEEGGDHVTYQQHAAGRHSQILEPSFVRLDRPQHVSKRTIEIALYAIERRNGDQ